MQGAEILRSQRAGQLNVDRNRDLPFDEPQARRSPFRSGLGEHRFGQKQKLGAKPFQLELAQQRLVLWRQIERDRRQLGGESLEFG